MTHFKKRVDAPPQHALFAFDARRLVRGLGDRIILTGKAAHEHVELGQLALAIPDLIDDNGNILVHTAARAEPTFIAAPCELFGCAAVRLPVVSPDRSERAGRRHVELRMFWIVIAFQAESEPADTGEQFSHSYRSLFHGTRYASICIGLQSAGNQTKNTARGFQTVGEQCPEGRAVIRRKKERKGFSSSL